jgi:hypothetical protein
MIDDEMDEVGEDEVNDLDPPVAPAAVPDFTYTIGGREIGFRRAARGQLVALSRVRFKAAQEVARISRMPATEELFQQVNNITLKAEIATLDLVESLILDPFDVEFLNTAMLEGSVEVDEIMAVMYGTKDVVDDDEDPKPVVRKASAKKAVKRVANAKRARK